MSLFIVSATSHITLPYSGFIIEKLIQRKKVIIFS